MFNKILASFKQDLGKVIIHFYTQVDSLESACFIVSDLDTFRLNSDLPDSSFSIQVSSGDSVSYFKVSETVFNQLTDFFALTKE